MNETPPTFVYPEMPTIIADMNTEIPKRDVEMTYLQKQSIDDTICQKLRNKDVYKTYMHKI